MIEVTEDGWVIIRRADYLWRDGIKNYRDEIRMGDGDILAQIDPAAFRDIEDAREIAAWINTRLALPEIKGS